MKRKGFIPGCQRGDYNIGRFNVNLFQVLYNMVLEPKAWALEPVYCKKQQKKFLTSYWFAE